MTHSGRSGLIPPWVIPAPQPVVVTVRNTAGRSPLLKALQALALGQRFEGVAATDIVPIAIELVESNVLLPELLPT